MTYLSEPRFTRFTICWPNDGTRQLEVTVDADLPAYSPMEKPINGIASIATSHAGLRRLLEDGYTDQWHVPVFPWAGGVIAVPWRPITDLSS